MKSEIEQKDGVPDLATLLGRADLAQRDGDWQSVHSIFQEIRDRLPDERAGWIRGGVMLHRHGDLAMAESVLSEAVRRFPDDAWVTVEYAVAAATAKDWREAIRRWALVRERFPDDRSGWLNGALTERRYGDDPAAAESLLAYVVEKYPDDASVAVEYALTAALRSDWPEEIRRWALVRERFPADRSGWVRGAQAEIRFGDPLAGERLLADAIERFPNDASFAIEHAAAAAARGDRPEEIRRWAYMRERFPAESSGWVRGGIAELRHGDPAAADLVLADAVRRFPEDWVAAREYAEAAAARRRWSEANRRWADCRHRFPDRREGWIQGARVSLWLMVEGLANGVHRDEHDAYVRLVLQEPVDWNDPEFVPAGVGITLLGGYDPKLQPAIMGRLSQAISERYSNGDVGEAVELIALCLNLHPGDDSAIERLVDKYVRCAGYRLFCNIFYEHNAANVAALLRWARRAVAETEPLPLGPAQAFQLLLCLEIHNPALSTAVLRHYLDNGTRDHGDKLTTLLGKVRSIRDRQASVEAPAIVSAASRRLRIGVCISGQLRGFEQALPTWSFLDAGHQIDRFVHVWQAVGWKIPGPTTANRTFTKPLAQAFAETCTRLGLAAVVSNFPSLFDYLVSGGDAATPARLMAVYSTEHVRVEDDSGGQFSSYSNQRKMLYKIRACHQLALDSGNHYDLLVRIRPDIALQGTANLDFERTYFECNRNRIIFADRNSWVERNGYCIGDQFAVGSLDCMTTFAETYDRTLEAASGLPSHIPGDFRPHVNLAHAIFGDGIRAQALPGVGFGPLLNPAVLSTDLVRELVLKDMGAGPRNIADELFLRACDEVA